jgi:uncharacterized membrane protein (UPF0182 family)
VPELRAYVVGRVDRVGNLELRQYEIGSGTNVSARGPIQIDEILNSDPEISEESTELGRGGSQFLSGNLNLLLVDNAVVYVRPFYVQREPLAENPNEETEPQVKFVAVVQEDRLGFAPTYPGALAELFNLTLEEAAALVGTTVDEIVQAGDDAPSGSLDLGDLGAEVTARLDVILAKFAEAEGALPDFAEYQRLQDEALAELRQLLSEVESSVVETPEDPAIDQDTDSA